MGFYGSKPISSVLLARTAYAPTIAQQVVFRRAHLTTHDGDIRTHFLYLSDVKRKINSLVL
jgi:hypothetical protein